MNNVFLIGRLTKDIELRTSESGKVVGTFNLAVNRPYKNDNGEYEADFINCVAFNHTAEFMAKYTHKGNLIAVNGRIQTRSYEDKDKNKRYVTEVIVNEVKPLEKKENNELDHMTSSQIIEKAMNDTPDNFKEFDLDDLELPF